MKKKTKKEITKEVVTLFEKEILAPLGDINIFLNEALKLAPSDDIINIIYLYWQKWSSFLKDDMTSKRVQEVIHLLKEV